MNRYNNKSKEDLNEVSKIYVVSIIDFLDNYKIDLKQKMKLIKNHLETKQYLFLNRKVASLKGI